MSHNVQSNQTYIKFFKKNKIYAKVDSSIKNTLATFNFAETTRSNRIFVTPDGRTEVWEIRIPDPERNKGKSGGFRLLVIYKKKVNVVFLDWIMPRAELNKPKVKQGYNRYLDGLKDKLVNSN